MTTNNPSTPSSAYTAMEPVWTRIDDIIAGADKIRSKKESYLPKYEAEDKAEYTRRLKSAPWRPEFVDGLESLASKPFGKDVGLKNPEGKMKDLAEDIDGQGNNLTAFARSVFRGGIARGMQAIFVDYPTIAPGATLADERKAKVRPYWISVPATDIIALYTEMRNGREVVTHVRFKETLVERDGFGEKVTNRIRVVEPGKWEIYEQKSATGRSVRSSTWEMVEFGTMTLPEVPLVLFWTGERKGSQYVKPPLIDLADMQIELYRKLSRQDEVETYAGSPMLQGQGIAPPGATDEPLQVGPKRVLYAPPGAEGEKTGWSYVSPEAGVLKEIRDSKNDTIQDMRRLAMQPMIPKTGTVTATATGVEAAKAHSVAQAWAIGLKDAIEQAFVFTAQWLGQADTKTEVEVNTDFAVEPNAQAPLDALDKARARGDIAHEDFLYGLRRYSVLPPDADIPAMVDRAAAEMPDEPDEEDIDASLPPRRKAA